MSAPLKTQTGCKDGTEGQASTSLLSAHCKPHYLPSFSLRQCFAWGARGLQSPRDHPALLIPSPAAQGEHPSRGGLSSLAVPRCKTGLPTLKKVSPSRGPPQVPTGKLQAGLSAEAVRKTQLQSCCWDGFAPSGSARPGDLGESDGVFLTKLDKNRKSFVVRDRPVSRDA